MKQMVHYKLLMSLIMLEDHYIVVPWPQVNELNLY